MTYASSCHVKRSFAEFSGFRWPEPSRSPEKVGYFACSPATSPSISQTDEGFKAVEGDPERRRERGRKSSEGKDRRGSKERSCPL